MLGIEKDDTTFDTDVLIHINSVLMELSQIGVGPVEGFIASDTDTWAQFLGYPSNVDLSTNKTITNLEAVKTIVYLKVRLLFDPPENSALIAAIEKQIERLEWRLNVQAESKREED